MNNTIPASQIVSIVPSVLGGGGKALDLNGLTLSNGTQVPIGTVASFPDAPSVSSYFGPASVEASMAATYFNGFDGATILPGALLFTQRPRTSVAAYLRGGSLASMTITQLNNISGVITVTIDGTSVTSSAIDLSGADSFSVAAATIQTALATTAVAVTGAIAPSVSTGVTGVIHGNTLTLFGSPRVFIGSAIGGSGVTAGTVVTGFLTGTGGHGTYTVNNSQTVAPIQTLTVTNGLMTVSAVATGTLAVGQVMTGTGVTVGTQIAALGTGTGGTGTYYVTPGQTASSTAITANPVTVTYDSQFQAFVITSGTLGAGSGMTFATGTASAALKLTAATGAVTSQGADPVSPGVFMDSVVSLTTNWASFTTTREASSGSQVAFSAWADAQTNRFAYVAWTSDSAPTVQGDVTSAGYQILQAGYSGTILLYETTGATNAAFVLAYFASLDFSATNGRATLAFRGQSGITPSVTDQLTAASLKANGYNYYGVWATAATQFNFISPGSITGKYSWADSFANQIQLNNQLQLALMTLLTTVGSVSYNAAGYTLIRSACADPIRQAVRFGTIRTGVTLSSLQVAEITAAAGLDISGTLGSRGWYLQIKDASAQVRAQRGTPPMALWYMDGESVQSINLASVLVQ